jgi:hypothetical protein
VSSGFSTDSNRVRLFENRAGNEILPDVSAGLWLWWSGVGFYVAPVLLVLAGIVVAFIVGKLIVR